MHRQEELTEERNRIGLRLAEVQELLDLVDWASQAARSVRRGSELRVEAAEIEAALGPLGDAIQAERMRVSQWIDFREKALSAESIVLSGQSSQSHTSVNCARCFGSFCRYHWQMRSNCLPRT